MAEPKDRRGPVEPGQSIVCPDCHGSTLVALCGRPVAGSEGPCVIRGGHFGPCWGEDDVASDWSPAASCRRCCVCPCGSTSDGSECRFCHITMTPGALPDTDRRWCPGCHGSRHMADGTTCHTCAGVGRVPLPEKTDGPVGPVTT